MVSIFFHNVFEFTLLCPGGIMSAAYGTIAVKLCKCMKERRVLSAHNHKKKNEKIKPQYQYSIKKKFHSMKIMRNSMFYKKSLNIYLNYKTGEKNETLLHNKVK